MVEARTPSPADDRTASGPNGRPGGWAARLPLIFIVIALIALLVVPFLIQRHTTALREERTEVLQPARDLVSEIQLSLAREMGALRGFVITGDEAFLDRYEEAVETEREAYRKLEPLLAERGPAVRRAYAELRTSTSRWHGRVTEADILMRRLVPEEFIRRIPSEEARYERTLQAAAQLRETILREVRINRAEIQQAERLGISLMAVLVLFALAAGFAAMGLYRRLGRFATEAQRGRAEVERIMADRERLMRGITHDLKNPLGAADGNAQLLESEVRGDITGEQRESVERIRRSLHSALSIIDDLLELSRAEAGELRIDREPTDIAEVVSEAADDQQGVADTEEVALSVELSEALPTVDTDADRVREILRNLLSNAVKFTPSGGRVSVRAEIRNGAAKQAPGPEDWLAVDVSDTGPGIPEAEHEQIFVEFAQLDESAGRGTGLGLPISRRVARALGGDLTIESEPGRGSTFTLWLPLEPEPAER